MKKVSKIFLLMCGVTLAFMSCTGNKTDLPVLSDAQAQYVNLEQIADSFIITPLHSKEELPNLWFICICGNEILAASDEKVYYFVDGEHVATLSAMGRGPGEYDYVSYIDYSPSEKILYLRPSGSDDILCYEVPSMRFTGKMPFQANSCCVVAPGHLLFDCSDMDGRLLVYYNQPENRLDTLMELEPYEGRQINLYSDRKGHASIGLNGYERKFLSFTLQDGLKEIYRFSYGAEGIPRFLTKYKVGDYKAQIRIHEFEGSFNFLEGVYSPNANCKNPYFWFVRRNNPEEDQVRLCLLTPEGPRVYKGFAIPGLQYFDPLACQTENGCAMMVSGPAEELIDSETPMSELGQKILDAVRSQSSGNPVLVQYQIKQ